MNSELLPLAQAVATARGWDEVTRHVMLAGKTLPAPDSALAIPQNQVAGCQSLVYLWNGQATEKPMTFQGWSDAKIIRGVLAILLEKANALSSQQILNYDFASYLDQIGLSRHLSQSRADGITQVIGRLRVLAGGS
ncbi:SufE family protein [Salinimonas sp. HHU 13199]|uniref:SufE family protein n=1 Tax=Salinimonas profundi TaxID=2729140 RepID=A0ABR8LLQ3_9ALTE|nr:SufE family protein [Salinimonas profundi]MBD3584844.1 SufE family protein [Salinimonas profundi]